MGVSNGDENKIVALRKRWQALQRATETGTADASETTELVTMALDTLDSLQQQLHLQTDELDGARKSLEEEYARYLDLFEACPDGYIVTDATGTIQAMSGMALELLEKQLDDVAGNNLADLIAADERAEFQRELSRLRAGMRTEAKGWEYRITTSGAQVRAVSLRSSVMQDGGGATVGIRWLMRDVTEMRQMQEAARKREAQFRALFDNAPLGIALVDLDMQILRCNAELQTFLGADSEALHGQCLLTMVPVPEREEVHRQLQALLDGKQERYSADVRYQHTSGQWVWATTVMSLGEAGAGIPDRNGDGNFVIVMVADITEQTEVRSEIAEVRRKLLESYEQERLYLAQELHDLPLQELYVTDMMVGELREMVSGNKPQDAIAKIRAQIQKINRILRDLCFELRPPSLANFGLRSAIEAHIATVCERHPALNVHLDLVPEEIVLPQWMGLALYRICQQALTNVVQHAQAENLYVVLSADSDTIELVVRDDGCGFQVPERWVTLTRANHLGLAGSAERASAVGATFAVHSRPGEGTVIQVTASRPQVDARAESSSDSKG